jgi:uncharacterized membrane protein
MRKPFSLIFCGCLVFGANIGLMAQIFHIRSDGYSGFGYWAIGALVMAWAVRSWLIGLLFLFTSFIWFAYFYGDGHEQASTAYPFALVALLLPLAFIARSRALYVVTLLGIIASACVIGGFGVNAKATLIMITSGGLFAWALGEFHKATNRYRDFSKAASGLGLSLLAIAAYIWSFHGLWSTSSKGNLSLLSTIFLILSVVGLVFILRSGKQERIWLLIGVFVVFALLCGGALLTRIERIEAEMLCTTLTNIAALTLGSAIIGTGVIEERRVPFWLGSLYIILLIFSRFLEYDTSLLLKSSVFIICGIVVIVAGASYEMYLRRKSLSAKDDDVGEKIYE